jgi:GxxExxY protein
MTFGEAFRADIVVDEKVIIGIKSVEQVSEAHKKQVQTYLQLTGCKLGFLLNSGESKAIDERLKKVTRRQVWLVSWS